MTRICNNGRRNVSIVEVGPSITTAAIAGNGSDAEVSRVLLCQHKYSHQDLKIVHSTLIKQRFHERKKKVQRIKKQF
jgi:hypothetical protein